MRVEELDGDGEWTPIVLKVTLETPREAWSLWHRLNVSAGRVETMTDDAPYRYHIEMQNDLWNVLDEALKARGQAAE